MSDRYPHDWRYGAQAFDPPVHVWAVPDEGVIRARRDWSALVDAEGEVIALAPPGDPAATLAAMLNWVVTEGERLVLRERAGGSDE